LPKLAGTRCSRRRHRRAGRHSGARGWSCRAWRTCMRTRIRCLLQSSGSGYERTVRGRLVLASARVTGPAPRWRRHEARATRPARAGGRRYGRLLVRGARATGSTSSCSAPRSRCPAGCGCGCGSTWRPPTAAQRYARPPYRSRGLRWARLCSVRAGHPPGSRASRPRGVSRPARRSWRPCQAALGSSKSGPGAAASVDFAPLVVTGPARRVTALPMSANA
jgi:hypothetical protein